VLQSGQYSVLIDTLKENAAKPEELARDVFMDL
jgi:hypothetical protein